MKLVNTPFQSYWCLPWTVQYQRNNIYDRKHYYRRTKAYSHWELREIHNGLRFGKKHMKIWASYLCLLSSCVDSVIVWCKSSDCERSVRRLVSAEHPSVYKIVSRVAQASSQADQLINKFIKFCKTLFTCYSILVFPWNKAIHNK